MTAPTFFMTILVMSIKTTTKTTAETAIVIRTLSVANLIINADDRTEQASEINILSIGVLPF
jgi:hypothetical protein